MRVCVLKYRHWRCQQVYEDSYLWPVSIGYTRKSRYKCYPIYIVTIY